MTKDEAKKILDYLTSKNMAFCFTPNGELVSREQCEAILDEGIESIE